ncbi:MAG: BfmA/BtgA family mobilization protein [Allomuricauda sp.]
MGDTYQKYRFSAISIKKDVALRFREFSRLVSNSHTSTLVAIMDFFERNDLSPNDDLGINNNRTNKRINAVIAILKNIEKHQTLPTKTMMDSLFHEMTEMEKEEEETFDFGTPKLLDANEELEFYKTGYGNLQEQLADVQEKMVSLLEKVIYIKSTFGSGYLKLEMDRESFDKLKNELQHVHNDYGTED